MLAGDDVQYPGRTPVHFDLSRRSAAIGPAVAAEPPQRNLHLGTLCRRTDPVPAPVPAQWRDTPTSGTLSFDCPTPPAFGGTQFGSVA